MGSTVILVESPNKIKHVEHYAHELGVKEPKVMATVGHILDLPGMREGLCVDLETFEPTSLVPKDERGQARLDAIQAAAQEAERVIVATDADREGEAIAAEVWDLIPRGRGFRAPFEEITLEGVRAGLASPMPELRSGLVDAAKARRILDRLFGWNATQLVFEKLQGFKGASAGRVQSVALRLVVERTRDHDAFKSTTTWAPWVRLRHTAPDGTPREFLARPKGDGQALVLPTKEEAEALKIPASVVCTSAEGREKEQKPRPPFTNSAWLQTAQKALKMPVAVASDAIQRLFEDGKTTYPRTDSVRVAPEAVEWARQVLAERFGPDYVPAKPWEHKDKPGVQGAHEAIRPTEPNQKVEGQWGEAFGLIEARFLASQAAARRVWETVLGFEGEGSLILEAKGMVELFPGWKRVLETDAAEEDDPKPGATTEEDEEEGGLPPVMKGDTLEVLGIVVKPVTTKAPALFTQASLVAELERKGVGRPSTFKAMVSLILEREFCREEEPKAARKPKKGEAVIPVIRPTELGFALSDFLVEAFPEALDYGWTAKIEKGLDLVEAGKLERRRFLEENWKRLKEALDRAAGLEARGREDLFAGPCPRCTEQGRSSRLKVIKGVKDCKPYEFHACELDTKDHRVCGFFRWPDNRKDFGPCPKCAKEDRKGHLRLVLYEKEGKKHEFAGCDQDTKEAKVCGYVADTKDGVLLEAVPCPTCAGPTKHIVKKDGGHAIYCDKHGNDGWFMADRNWKLVSRPKCPTCAKPMTHQKKKDGGDFFWACFEHKVFHDSDKFGKVVKDGPKMPKKVGGAA